MSVGACPRACPRDMSAGASKPPVTSGVPPPGPGRHDAVPHGRSPAQLSPMGSMVPRACPRVMAGTVTFDPMVRRGRSSSPWAATKSTTSSSSRSGSGRRRCETASTRCRTARASGARSPGSQARFRGVKAEGGWAAVCTEDALVSADSDFWPVCLAARLGRRRRAQPRAHGGGGPPARIAGRDRADTRGAHGNTRESRRPAIAPSQLASDYSRPSSRRRWSTATSAASRPTGFGRRRPSRDAGFDIVYVYGGHSYLPLPVPLAVLQPAHRRVRRLAREPRALLARDARARPRGGRRRLRDRRPALRGGARARRRRARGGARVRPPRRPPRRPLGRQRRLDRRVGRRTPARPASSRRATSSSGPGACARRPRSRSSASAG